MARACVLRVARLRPRARAGIAVMAVRRASGRQICRFGEITVDCKMQTSINLQLYLLYIPVRRRTTQVYIIPFLVFLL